MDAAGGPVASSASPYGGGQGQGQGQGTAAFPIAIVIAIGFMVTSLILISYYFLVVRCWLRGDGPGSGLLHRSRRDNGIINSRAVERVSAVFFTDHGAAADEHPGGLDPDVVAALPVVRWHHRRRWSSSSSSSASECAVCLGEFAPGERLKQLPACAHAFHIDCIDTWLHHNVSCPLCRTVVTAAGLPLVRDDRDLQLQQLGDMDAAGRFVGSSCRFPATTKTAAGAAAEEEDRITRSFSMDCFAGGRGRKPPQPQGKEAAAGGGGAGSSGEAGPSLAAGSSSNVVAGETSGRFRRLLSSFGLGRSSRSTVLPIHLDP